MIYPRITHTHFDFTTPKGLKITPNDDKKGKREREKEEQSGRDFFNTGFINPDIYIYIPRLPKLIKRKKKRNKFTLYKI